MATETEWVKGGDRNLGASQTERQRKTFEERQKRKEIGAGKSRSEAQRGNPKGTLESEIRNAIS